MKAIFGGLLEFEDRARLTEFIEKTDVRTSLQIIENALEYGIKNGTYSLDEAFCIYKCLVGIQEHIKEIEKIPPF